MALELPFMKKKATSDDLQLQINQLNYDLKRAQGKLKTESQFISDQLKKTPFAGRLYDYGFLKITQKKGVVTGQSGQEEFEKFQHRSVKTEFPTPIRRFRLVLEYPNFNVEQTYYWFLRFFNETWGFEKVEKVIDTMAQSVSSSTFGNMQSRLGAQQAQASQYLKGVSEMVKGLFQMVREIRILDERLQFYYDSDGDKKGNPKNALSSEIVLKGLWIDQVEGGAKNPGSVYGLSQTMGFTILPDLFFRVQIKDKDRLEVDVDNLAFNLKVKEVLKRKLRQYYEWKWRTKKELEVRKQFEIRYLRQHYDTIKLYMAWVKPYLRNIQRMKLYEKNMENPNIINAFETQIIEIETLFIRDDFGHAASVLSMHLFYRVKPELSYHAYEYQNKGPIYTGMADITLRAYSWTHEQIEQYKKYRKDDDLDLMSTIDDSVKAAMEALGDELKKYLKEADPNMEFPGDEKKQEPEKGPSAPSILEPFIAIFEGFKEIAQGFTGGPVSPEKKPQKKKEEKKKRSDDIKHHRAEHFAAEAAWEGYYRFKMGPGGNLYWLE